MANAALAHYCVVRRDLPLGVIAAQLIHAAGCSARGPPPPHTHAVALSVSDEAALILLTDRMRDLGIELVAIREPRPAVPRRADGRRRGSDEPPRRSPAPRTGATPPPHLKPNETRMYEHNLINHQALREDIAALAQQLRTHKGALRRTWTEPMGDVQAEVHRLKNDATERLILLAHARGRRHLSSPPRWMRDAGLSDDLDPYQERVATRLAKDYRPRFRGH